MELGTLGKNTMKGARGGPRRTEKTRVWTEDEKRVAAPASVDIQAYKYGV